MSQPAPQWSKAQKISFRFVFIFLVLHILPFPFSSLPLLGVLSGIAPSLTQWYYELISLYTSFWNIVVPWAGEYILGLPEKITIFNSGSGDKTYDFVKHFLVLLLSSIGMVVWSVLDRNRLSYNHMHDALRVLVRYYLGMMMLVYGVIKVFHLQMPPPMLSHLVTPFGDKSPMGLAWSYVGLSNAFSVFAGSMECIAGLLLFFRRTTTLGAILTAIIMLNVAVMNFCFDIPVKLYSVLLLLMAFFLLAPEGKRLLNVLIFNRTADPFYQPHFIPKGKLRVFAVVFKILFILSVLYDNISSSISSLYTYGPLRPKPALYGIYDVDQIRINEINQPLLLTDTIHWKQIIIQASSYAQVKMMNDSMQYLVFDIDTLTGDFTFYKSTDTLSKTKLHYRLEEGLLKLEGVIGSDSVQWQYKQRDLNSFRLINRKFRWVQEYPYNR